MKPSNLVEDKGAKSCSKRCLVKDRRCSVHTSSPVFQRRAFYIFGYTGEEKRTWTKAESVNLRMNLKIES